MGECQVIVSPTATELKASALRSLEFRTLWTLWNGGSGSYFCSSSLHSCTWWNVKRWPFYGFRYVTAHKQTSNTVNNGSENKPAERSWYVVKSLRSWFVPTGSVERCGRGLPTQYYWRVYCWCTAVDRAASLESRDPQWPAPPPQESAVNPVLHYLATNNTYFTTTLYWQYMT